MGTMKYSLASLYRGFTQSSKRAGFTLIELLVVMGIIGILASVVLASLNSAREKGSIAAAQAEINGIRKAFELLYWDTNLYPNGADSYCRASPGADNEVPLNGAGAGLTGDSGESGWSGPYLPDAIDPWGTTYFLDEDYDCDPAVRGCMDHSDEVSVIVSCGPDRDVSGSGDSCEYNSDNIVYLLCP